MPTMLTTARRELAEINKRWPAALREIPPHQWPGHLDGAHRRMPARVLRSRDFFVQIYESSERRLRLTVNRTALTEHGGWKDGITWDDLQRLKREAGYGAWWAVEIYPADAAVVNVANLRHLWLSPVAIPFGWLAPT